jgi:uncharacterized membrane protein
MNKSRLEAFSDAVIAIVMTIMVLELKIPHGTTVDVLLPLVPVFLAYVLSFIYLAIYWNNHHHMLQAARNINGKVLWANMHRWFWLSLIPFATGWMGENHFEALPTAVYGTVLLMAAVSYTILQKNLVRHGKEENSTLKEAVGKDIKGKFSLVCYAVSIPLAFVHQNISHAIYIAVAAIWFIPDPRIEKAVKK